MYLLHGFVYYNKPSTTVHYHKAASWNWAMRKEPHPEEPHKLKAGDLFHECLMDKARLCGPFFSKKCPTCNEGVPKNLYNYALVLRLKCI